MGEQKLTERKKKADVTAKTGFDLEKLTAKESVFLPMSYREETEEVEFCYELSGVKSVRELQSEPKEKQYQFLINFGKLEEVWEGYRILLTEENLYYDENLLPLIRFRDLYEQGERADREGFLFFYKSFIGGLLGRKYSVRQIQESGLSILKGESSFQVFGEAKDREELERVLRKEKEEYVTRQRERYCEVSRQANQVKTLLSAVLPVLLAGSAAFLCYLGLWVLPFQKKVIQANEAYLQSEYVSCIESLAEVETERLDAATKYILAVSYARTESLKQEEISGIVSKLSVQSNEKELEYWIVLGWGEAPEAENLAKALSDDKLLLYAYMKELNQLESDTTVSGEEKASRIEELESLIQSLGDKYTGAEE